VKILKGGRTGLLLFENSGALNQIRQLSTVDLRSNGGRRARAPWTRPWARSTSPPWTIPLKRRGTRPGPSIADPRVLDACVRRAAATTPETGAARRRLAGNSPAYSNSLLRAPIRAHAGSTRSWGACEQALGVREVARASTAAGAGRGRIGLAGDLAGRLKRARKGK
jgi:hypothetical protein